MSEEVYGDSQTCFRFFVAHFPESQSTVQRNAKKKTANNNRNAVCMAGLLGMSDDLRG